MSEYISTAQLAAIWGISIRRARILAERIPGTFRVNGRNWVIPREAVPPLDEVVKVAARPKKNTPK